MAKFSIEHGRSTQLVEPTAKPQGVGGGLCRQPDDYRKLPLRYELVMDDKIQKLLDAPGSVLGSSEELIQEQLEAKHPCPVVGATYLHRCDWDLELTETETNSYSRRRRHVKTGRTKSVTGWLVMEQPILQFADIQALQDITIKHGAVLIDADQADSLGSKEDVRAAGFTLVDRRFELVQVNFNPRYTRLTKYREKVAQYQVRMADGFPTLAIHAFYMLMTPDNGPEGHCDLRIRKEVLADPREVVRCWRTVKKFWGPFWRTRKDCVYASHTGNESAGTRGWGNGRRRGGHRGETQQFTFVEAIKACLPYLHGEEKNEHSNRDFCKFLRAEARAMKIKIPAAPREPKKPKFKRRKPIRRSKHEIEQSRLAVDAATKLLRNELGREVPDAKASN